MSALLGLQFSVISIGGDKVILSPLPSRPEAWITIINVRQHFRNLEIYLDLEIWQMHTCYSARVIFLVFELSRFSGRKETLLSAQQGLGFCVVVKSGKNIDGTVSR